MLSNKDTSNTQKSNVIYCLTCPSCNKNYIAKTDHDLVTHLDEHDSSDDQPIHQHLSNVNILWTL